MTNKSLNDLYNDAKDAMQTGEWKKGREIALEIIKDDPDFIKGWTLLFIYEVRKGVLGKTNSLEEYEINDIPYEVLEGQATEKKVLSFRNSFIDHLKKQYDLR